MPLLGDATTPTEGLQLGIEQWSNGEIEQSSNPAVEGCANLKKCAFKQRLTDGETSNTNTNSAKSVERDGR